MATQQDNWEAVKALFEAALEEDAASRSSFLKARCPDASVCAEVERLLAEHDEAKSFLSTPVVASIPVPVEPKASPSRLSEGGVPGKRLVNIGPYRVIGEIGRGGMGIVYKATDSAGNRTVAIKLIQGAASMNRRGRMGLVREARAAGSLNHPNIVAIYDIGQYRGWLYLVMEYLSGAPLDRVIRSDHPLSLRQKLKILIQLCDALNHAHCNGVVHRDVKPANTFLVGVDRTVKVLDFGLAIQTSVSGDGQLAGTFAYMSPEQLRGEKLDGRADVWSAGVTAYELLTGSVPFRAATFGEFRQQIFTAPIPRLDASIPLAAELTLALDRALAKTQEARCTAMELARDLRLLEQGLESSGHARGPATEAAPTGVSRAMPEVERGPSEQYPPAHYERPDLGFRRASAGTAAIRRGEFGLQRVQRDLREMERSILPSSLSVGGRAGVLLALLALPFLLLSHAVRWALWGLELIVRHPRCRGCGLTMSLTSNWTRLVKSNTEVVLGYRDCVAALEENLWEDAAKLLCVHGSEGSVLYGSELISTPLRYHLEFYECGICAHHAARLTTDDLLEHEWISRLDFTEAYQGKHESIITTLKGMGTAPSHVARTVVGCVRHAFRHANPLQINPLVVAMFLLLSLLGAASLQSRRAQKARAQAPRFQPAKQSEPDARSMAVKYYFGYGVRRDRTLAAEYYRMAANRGDSVSANALGEMYEKAIGLPQSYTKAISWYRVAAQGGDSNAMMNLGRVYENGIGVEKDMVVAMSWYSLSAKAGNQEAAARISHLRPK